MKLKFYITCCFGLIASFFSTSCEDFLEIDAPIDKLVREEVFNSEETAQSAMTGIYNELFRAACCNGNRSSITVVSGLSSDIIRNINSTNLERMQFEQNELLPDNQSNFEIWASAYNIIYMANSFLEGLENSEEIDPELLNQLEGEAKYIRAFVYFYLTNLYGEVPLVLTSNYNQNALAPRESQSIIYDQILEDLHSAVSLLNMEYRGGERTSVNSGAAMALLARVYLYLENWERAENFSSQVIYETSVYEVIDDLDLVFKANSKEAIWQISPIGRGSSSTHTSEGNIFIIDPVFSFFATVQMKENFVKSFDSKDRRLINWIAYSSGKNSHFPYKYKIWNSSELPIEEYSMVLRLGEQFLIRAEARAQQGNFAGAIADIDVIKRRAGIDLIADTNAGISQEDLLNEIYKERKKELFTEWGHRWFDLKRSGKGGEVLADKYSTWNDTDLLYPIPAAERMKNPNLSQNPGY